jgi:hypothetical protein
MPDSFFQCKSRGKDFIGFDLAEPMNMIRFALVVINMGIAQYEIIQNSNIKRLTCDFSCLTFTVAHHGNWLAKLSSYLAIAMRKINDESTASH